jgi:hypothetical protein
MTTDTFKPSLVLLAAALALAPAAHADVYKWVDEKGVVNYSSSAPEKRKSVKLDEDNGRVSTIQSDYARDDVTTQRERALQQRVARLEQEAALSRQTAAQQEAVAQEAYRQWREQCFAQRRVDCDDPYASAYEPGYVSPYPIYRPGVRPPQSRPVPGMYRPTPRFAVGGGGVVGPYYAPPPGGIAVGPGAYGIGGGIYRAPPGGVVVGPGPGGIGAAYYPVPETAGRATQAPRPQPRPVLQ